MAELELLEELEKALPYIEEVAERALPVLREGWRSLERWRYHRNNPPGGHVLGHGDAYGAGAGPVIRDWKDPNQPKLPYKIKKKRKLSDLIITPIGTPNRTDDPPIIPIGWPQDMSDESSDDESNGSNPMGHGKTRRINFRRVAPQKSKKRKAEYSSTDTQVFNSTQQLNATRNKQGIHSLGLAENVTNLGDMLKIHTLSVVTTPSETDIKTIANARMLYNIEKRVIFRNNSNFKAKLAIFSVMLKEPTNDSLKTIMQNGLTEADFMGTGINAEDYSVTLKDAQPYFGERVKIKLFGRVELSPGDESIMSYKSKTKLYTQEKVDDNGFTYQRGYQQWLVVQTGVLAHDALDPTKVGYSESNIDVHEHARLKARVAYNGDFKNLTFTDTLVDPVGDHEAWESTAHSKHSSAFA